ncbi:WecB/TagA/CpsF family glycosyltransferase [Vibrio cyclitrophicus]
MKSIYVNNKRLFAFKDINNVIDTLHDNIYVSLGAESIVNKSQKFEDVVNSSIGYADGEAAVLALKKMNFHSSQKIPGCELWLEVIRSKPNARIALIGATVEVLNGVHNQLKESFPDLNIVFTQDGYYSDEKEIITSISNIKPEFVFIALGQPKQEVLASRLRAIHSAKYFCVGGSFDVYFGTAERAPKIYIQLKLEWLYRLLKEPKRALRQRSIPLFLFKYFFDRGFIRE